MDQTTKALKSEAREERSLPQKSLQSFIHFGNQHFDRRITKAVVSHFKFQYPTTIQTKMIPMALEGKDMLVRARTGSGKTLGYAIPVIHRLLNSYEVDGRVLGPLKAIILVPTKELCEQVYEVFYHLLRFCNDCLSVERFSEFKKTLISAPSLLPTILITTPTTLLTLITEMNKQSSKYFTLKTRVEIVVVDEADLIFSYGFQEDMQKVSHLLPTSSSQTYQALLCSATLTSEVEQLKKIMLHKPLIVFLDEEEEESGGILKEFYYSCLEEDKWLFIYAAIKLEVLPMKCLIFVSTIDRAHRLSLFLNQFSLSSSVLCPTLPFASRQTILQSFNQNIFEILIVTEETMAFDEQTTLPCNSTEIASRSPKTKKISQAAENDYVAIHRGLDLHGVACVVNFDIPSTKNAYIHRIGRTGRGGASGTALSLFSTNCKEETHFLQTLLSEKTTLPSPLEKRTFHRFEFDLLAVEKFRYRVVDVLRSLTKKRVAARRLHLLQKEILHSHHLKSHFKGNPKDALALKKAVRTHTSQQVISEQLHILPSYLETSPLAVKKTAVQLAVAEETKKAASENPTLACTYTSQKRKISSNPLRTFDASNQKKQAVRFSCYNQLKREPLSYKLTAPEELPVLAGRKLWKLRHKKKLKKPGLPGNFLKKKPFSKRK